jgi:hypothetical protein
MAAFACGVMRALQATKLENFQPHRHTTPVTGQAASTFLRRECILTTMRPSFIPSSNGWFGIRQNAVLKLRLIHHVRLD